MDARTQGALLLAVGGVAVRLGLTGTALNFIRPAYVPLLVAAGAVLLVLGGATLWRALRDVGAGPGHGGHDVAEGHGHGGDDVAEGHDAASHDPVLADLPIHGATGLPPDDGHGHDHSRGPRVAWLLAAPLFAVLLIAPPPLGSYAAARQSGAVLESDTVFGDLPAPVDGAVELGVADYATRALYDVDRTLEGQQVRLVGFVSDVQADRWVLTRFSISCCAADGRPVNVEILGGPPPPAVDQWIEVEGTWQPRPDHEVGELTTDPPLLQAASFRQVPQPEQPYES
jgi:uncharacterized repeat protein (TIGR03943 family)